MKFTSRRSTQSTLSVALTLSASFFASNIADAKPAKIAWKKTFESALQEAKKTGKPIMVDFYTVWCPPCKLLDKEIYTNAGVVQESRKWVSVKVDAEKRTDLAQKYGVSGFPTILFLKPNGSVSAVKNGLMGPPKPSNDMKVVLKFMRQDMIKTMRYARKKAVTARA